jgi:hypothetical protein
MHTCKVETSFENVQFENNINIDKYIGCGHLNWVDITDSLFFFFNGTDLC